MHWPFQAHPQLHGAYTLANRLGDNTAGRQYRRDRGHQQHPRTPDKNRVPREVQREGQLKGKLPNDPPHKGDVTLHAQESTDLFTSLMAGRAGPSMLELIHDIWADQIRAHWPGDELAVQAIAGAFGSTIRWWLSKAPDLSPTQVDQRFRKVVEPTLLDRSGASDYLHP